MKQLIITFILVTALAFTAWSQTDVNFNITHKLGDNPFSMGMVSSNSLGNEFTVSRLQYYVSEISVIHDGGTETMINDLYLLIDASESETNSVNLGNLAVTNVEAIKFHIGVDELSNHANPISWAVGHPLAPTSPSMHWGWTAGYRFLAYEGNSGSGQEQTFQIHSLGDSNYFTLEIPLNVMATNGVVNINLDADYARGLEGIDLDSGIIVHGEGGEAKDALENFRDNVFTPSANSVSTIDISEINSFDIFPNPSLNGKTNLTLNTSKDIDYEITIVDVLGREIEHFYNVKSNDNIELSLEEKGFYFVNLIKEGQAVLNQKLVVR